MLKRAINVGQRSNWENTATPSMATIRGVISPLFAVDDAHTAQCLGDESFLCKKPVAKKSKLLQKVGKVCNEHAQSEYFDMSCQSQARTPLGQSSEETLPAGSLD